jgi:molybdopterin/thiamine biosynthesis adenylyltransferase
MINIAIIGCGGINSWAVMHLKQLFGTFINEKEIIYVKLFDNDIVEEKNILRNNQNFIPEDLMKGKAEVLAQRYGFDFKNDIITKDNIDLLKNFDYIIIGVDNLKARQLIYEYGLNTFKAVLDLKAQGTQIGYVVLDHKKTMEYYNAKYFSGPAMERTGSCQLNTDIERDNIQTGNRNIAHFGIYGIFLKLLRREDILNNEWQIAY